MKEQKTVLSTQSNGETTIVMPITKLECIEDTATSVDSASDTDYIPVIDNADDGQMKKITVGNLLSGVSELATAAKSAAETAQTTANSAKSTADSAKTAAAAAQSAASEAASAAETAQAAASSAASASTPVSFSVATSSWTTLSTAVAGRTYKATISASGVTTSDFPDVYFNSSSIEAATAADIVADTAANYVVLYAKTKPTATLSGSYFVRKGS